MDRLWRDYEAVANGERRTEHGHHRVARPVVAVEDLGEPEAA
ncbi:hypothetical protein [Actinoplanes lobatus]|uniref:Uncharacterized protein n=1 Tax=Actinoplanes lobatus TaxID=113568 RepID=A0A7W7HHB8_9ACTN|nr:hypothetical protein [Actinoplanes lobatus]MBB4750548.1 hypothetical protein [Actinoplanes lobatus]